MRNSALLFIMFLSSSCCLFRSGASKQPNSHNLGKFIDTVTQGGRIYYAYLAMNGPSGVVWLRNTKDLVNTKSDIPLLVISAVKTTVTEAEKIACSSLEIVDEAKTWVACGPLVSETVCLVAGAGSGILEGNGGALEECQVDWAYLMGQGWGDCMSGILDDVAGLFSSSPEMAAFELNMNLAQGKSSEGVKSALSLLCDGVEGKGPDANPGPTHPLGNIFNPAPVNASSGNGTPGNVLPNPGNAKNPPGNNNNRPNGAPDPGNKPAPVAPGDPGGSPLIPAGHDPGIPGPGSLPGQPFNAPVGPPAAPASQPGDDQDKPIVITKNDGPNDPGEDHEGDGDEGEREDGGEREAVLMIRDFAISANAHKTAMVAVLPSAPTSAASKPIADSVIIRRNTARLIAKAFLIKTYGANIILKEKPYEQNLVNGYWIINGTPAPQTNNSAFMIVIDARTGEIVKVFP